MAIGFLTPLPIGLLSRLGVGALRATVTVTGVNPVSTKRTSAPLRQLTVTGVTTAAKKSSTHPLATLTLSQGTIASTHRVSVTPAVFSLTVITDAIKVTTSPVGGVSSSGIIPATRKRADAPVATSALIGNPGDIIPGLIEVSQATASLSPVIPSTTKLQALAPTLLTLSAVGPESHTGHTLEPVPLTIEALSPPPSKVNTPTPGVMEISATLPGTGQIAHLTPWDLVLFAIPPSMTVPNLAGTAGLVASGIIPSTQKEITCPIASLNFRGTVAVLDNEFEEAELVKISYGREFPWYHRSLTKV